jgi:hypothetical protein
MGIKSNYFRHSFTAHQDIKIQKLIKQVGIRGYAIYFLLLEIYCGKLRDDDSGNTEQEIDLKFMASLLGVRSDSVRSCIIVMGQLDLLIQLSTNYDQTMIKLSIPNSLKYFGSYKYVREEKIPYKSKIKENKIKEIEIYKEISETKNVAEQLNKSNAPTLDEVMQLWNETMTVGNKFYCRALPSKALPLFAETTMKLKTLDGWKEVFEKAKQSKFLMGDSKSGWRPSLDFYCNHNFVVKILNDGYLGMQKESEYEKWKREFMAQDANTNH